jgi:hypothetical protein
VLRRRRSASHAHNLHNRCWQCCQNVFARVSEALGWPVRLLSSIRGLRRLNKDSEQAVGRAGTCVGLASRAGGCGSIAMTSPPLSSSRDLCTCKRYCRRATITETRVKRAPMIAMIMVTVSSGEPLSVVSPVALPVAACKAVAAAGRRTVLRLRPWRGRY